jgi:hypothetical protein
VEGVKRKKESPPRLETERAEEATRWSMGLEGACVKGVIAVSRGNYAPVCQGLARWKRPARAMGMPGGALRLDPAVGQGSDLERAPATHQGRLFKIEGDK